MKHCHSYMESLRLSWSVCTSTVLSSESGFSTLMSFRFLFTRKTISPIAPSDMTANNKISRTPMVEGIG